MKKATLLIFCLLTLFTARAQRPDFSYKFYGFVRGDLYYNSRDNAEAINGIFYLYPLDKSPDANGKDLNSGFNGNFHTLTSRIGLDVTGPNLGSARTSLKLETDFGGFSSAFYMLRLRQAYLKLDWEKGSSLLLGQTWHPLFGDLYPNVINLSTGGPFQPFNRSTQIRYEYGTTRIKFTGAAVYQLMSLSASPDGKSDEYMKYGLIPELYAGLNYYTNDLMVGAGIEMLSLKPRKESTGPMGAVYKVDERITTFSYLAQARYATGKFMATAKTLLASNLGHTTLLGGYGVSSVDPVTGEQEYTANRHSTSWLNMTYGDKWKGHFFGGYSKNLGTGKELLSTGSKDYFGSGADIDQLASGMLGFSYNIPHWQAGVEYSLTTAWYGDTDLASGKVKNTHSVTNHRILFMFTYLF